MTQEPAPDDNPQPQLPPLEPPPRQRRTGWWVLVAVVALGGVVAAAAYWVTPMRLVADQRLAADEERIAQLEAQLNRPPAEPASLAALRARVAALEARPAAAPDDAAQKAAEDAEQTLSARIDALDSRIASMSTAQAHGDPADAAKLAAVADLRAALAGSGPYDSELDALRRLGIDGALLKPLEASAKTGLLDRALLAGEFRTRTAPALLAAEKAAPAPEPEDFTDRVIARLEGLVTIKRADEPESPSSQRAAEAQLAIRRGDLEGAIETLKMLGGKEAEAARPIIDEMQARLDAEHAVDTIAQQIAARLSGDEAH
jgi:hypothetical protein